MPDFGRVFLVLNYTDITQKHLCPKLNGYGDYGQRKMWASLVSTYCTPSVMSYLSNAPDRRDMVMVVTLARALQSVGSSDVTR